MTLLRSLVFNFAAFGWSIFLLIAFIPLVFASRAAMLWAVRFWTHGVFWLQRHILSLDFEFRGLKNLPDGPFIVAASHQSAWDTICFYAVLEDPAFVLKKELYNIPMFGPYARKLGMIAIDRSAGASEARRMIRSVSSALEAGRPVVIFPGGTRSGPDEIVELKAGISALYRRCGVPVVPLSLNSGWFWGRRSFIKKPGKILAEFHVPIAPGQETTTFDEMLTSRIHDGNRVLLDEARNR
jgi:1-acyl-sn-glycerol-3-phosphate acyltransferase